MKIQFEISSVWQIILIGTKFFKLFATKFFFSWISFKFWNRFETNWQFLYNRLCLSRLTEERKLASFLQQNSNFIYGLDELHNILTFPSIFLMHRSKCVLATVPPRKYESLPFDSVGFSQIRFTEQTHWTTFSQFMSFIFGVNSKQKFHSKLKFPQSGADFASVKNFEYLFAIFATFVTAARVM